MERPNTQNEKPTCNIYACSLWWDSSRTRQKMILENQMSKHPNRPARAATTSTRVKARCLDSSGEHTTGDRHCPTPRPRTTADARKKYMCPPVEHHEIRAKNGSTYQWSLKLLLDAIQNGGYVNASTVNLMESPNYNKLSHKLGACLLWLKKRVPCQFACHFSTIWVPDKHALGEIQKRILLLSL